MGVGPAPGAAAFCPGFACSHMVSVCGGVLAAGRWPGWKCSSFLGVGQAIGLDGLGSTREELQSCRFLRQSCEAGNGAIAKCCPSKSGCVTPGG